MKDLPATTPKYVVWANVGDIANGIPIDVLPIAFLTRSYTIRERQETDMHYLSWRDFAAPGGGHLTGKALCDALAKQSLPGVVVCLSGKE